METIIPLISSGTEGPLGVKHLPRLWLKALLSATGRLPDGYKNIGPGFDHLVLEGLGINPDSARDYIVKTLPTYPMFERWVREQPGVNLAPENLSKINAAIVGREKSAEARRQILEEIGLPDETTIKDGVMLNNLDDWNSVHGQVSGSVREVE